MNRRAAAEAGDADETCPICKTNRYSKANLKLLINPECYHRMCETCVTRIFTDAPAQCPTAGCTRTLRRKGFREPYFNDLSVEREIDIRRRVATVFNRVEDDFETLDDYNEYLQTVEDLTFDLVTGSDAQRRAAEGKLHSYEAEHRVEIERGRRMGAEASERSRRQIEADKEEANRRRAEFFRRDQEEKLRTEQRRADALAELAGEKVPKREPLSQPEEGRVELKRRGKAGLGGAAGIKMESNGGSGMDWSADVGKLSIRGLKEKKKPAAAQGPYDPFGGVDFRPGRFRIHEGHPNHWEKDQRLEPELLTGGYSFAEFTARIMFEAFSGLGVFVEDEKGADEKGGVIIKKEVQSGDEMDVDTTSG
jgi:CDK-activating kinase assembly factor MAT1